MEILRAGLDSLHASALGEDNSLHLASSVVLDFVAAKEADQLEENFRDPPFPRSRYRHGFTSDVVGALSSGDEPSGHYVLESDRAGPRRKPGCLVLLK